MKDFSRKTAIVMLLAIVAGTTSAFIATRIEAREPQIVIAQFDAWSLGGEPGEDPHLKTIPTIQESEPLGVDYYEAPVLLDDCSISSEGLWEGRGRCLGSRVNLAWRKHLRAWLWQLHR